MGLGEIGGNTLTVFKSWCANRGYIQSDGAGVSECGGVDKRICGEFLNFGIDNVRQITLLTLTQSLKPRTSPLGGVGGEKGGEMV